MNNPFSYEGKRVVVTGAATGVGIFTAAMTTGQVDFGALA